jgi:hypothetical protein
VTERQGLELIEILRNRLGLQYHAGIDEGRREIVRVLTEETQMNRDEADATVTRLIDSGMMRYITGAERDMDQSIAPLDRDSGHGERTDRSRVDEMADNLTVNAVPGAGGPQAATTGMVAGAPAPIAAGGLTTPPAIPVAAGDAPVANAEDLQRGGYWEFNGEGAGVIPSPTRKGQVEPRGT